MRNKSNNIDFLLKYLNFLVYVNAIISFTIFLGEIVAIWVDIPIVYISKGDPIGISEFSGNWFDHIIKGMIGLLLTIIFIRSLMCYNKNRPKAQSFAIGGSFVIISLGILYVLIWFAQFLDSAINQSLNEYIWYSGFRLEIVLLIINFPVLVIWKNKFKIFQKMTSITT